MIYIVDAQLPRKLSIWLNENGFESIHTLDLPDQNDTQDLEIIRISTEMENSVVVSKDKDFPDYRFYTATQMA
jgi:predicted nuclease of predicted toxin-antitoxin system